MPKEKSMFETFDWLMAEIVADLPDSIMIGLTSLPTETLKKKMKNRVLELARDRGITLSQDEIPE